MQTEESKPAWRGQKGSAVGMKSERERNPDYSWPGNNGRFDFCSKYHRKPLVSYMQRSEIIFVIKMIIVSETKKLPDTEVDGD